MLRVTLSVLFSSLLSHVANSDTVRVELSKIADDTVTFDQVKPIFDSNCADCHGTTGPKAGLNLAVFPFTSTRIAELPLIVDKVLSRVSDGTRPMPPKSRPALTADQIALLQAWKDGGLQTEAKLVYVTTIKVVGDDGLVKHENIAESDLNPFDSGVVYELALPTTDPSSSSESSMVSE